MKNFYIYFIHLSILINETKFKFIFNYEVEIFYKEYIFQLLLL